MNTRTLHSSYSVVANHLRLLESNPQISWPATYKLSAHDCFSINRLLDFYPNKPTVIDCTTASTSGATTALLLQHDNVEQVITASLDLEKPLDPSISQLVGKSAATINSIQENKLRILETPLTDNDQWHSLLKDITPFSPIVFFLHPDPDLEVFSRHLNVLFDLHAKPTIIITPVGWLTSGGALEYTTLSCQKHLREISLIREISPFLAESQLAILWHQEQYYIRNLIRSISQEFKGNFDFISLLDDKLNADEKIRELEQQLCDIRTLQHLHAEAHNQAHAESQKTLTSPEIDSSLSAHVPEAIPQQGSPSTNVLKRTYQKIVPQKIRSIIFNLRQRLR